MSIEKLLKTNVNEHTEKKGKLTYLSWAWAWAEALKADPTATFEVKTFRYDQYTDLPFMSVNGTAMVWVTVTMFGKPMTCQLPVMNHKNEAIVNPDAFAVNTAIMRCLTKALGLHGLGLYIYAGEDLPEGAPSPTEAEDEAFEAQHLETMREAAMNGLDALEAAFKAIPVSQAKSRFWAKHQANLKQAAQGVKND